MYKIVVIPVLLAFVISILAGPVLIALLRRLKALQVERTDGVAAHLVKNGTPTMGGLIFLISAVVTALCFVKDYAGMIPVVFLMLGFGMIGCLDDLLKIVGKKPDGLKPAQKFFCQAVVTAVYAAYLMHYSSELLVMHIPFWGDHMLELGWLAVPLLFFVVLGTVNGVNFTDGVDGLAASVTIMIAVFYLVVSIGEQSGLEPMICAVIGSLLGFLVFNVFPAKIFMGDTGSLALGGFVAGTAYQLQLQLFLPLIGAVYVVEILSVVLQVTYFRKANGKRLFRMTPLHHHFELGGWSETRIVTVFTVATAVCCMIGLLGV
ncbi:MAG: phospho-N-acetylmuramoyl-pentapeptide-transferase [Lachnospiraceae bacterium]|nr:phospho-N-acetylmuramoyl-pentapeptide-transferase [Lachnospiraceae bacterium]